MAQTTSPKLDAGDRFPAMTISMLDGSHLQVPDDLRAQFTVFLVYRGQW